MKGTPLSIADPRLGRHVEHDDRSRRFLAAQAPAQRSVLWGHHAPVLDQGQLGSCTGNAMAQLLNTDPFTKSRAAVKAGFLNEQDALKLYHDATVLDGFPGTYPPDDTGSSGLGVAKAAKKEGFISVYNHAFGLTHFLAALQLQPVIVGTDWTDGMFKPNKKGFVKPTGSIAGGHEFLALGVDYSTKVITFLNSWSSGWGPLGGRFLMSFTDFGKLLGSQGDVTAPVTA
jgi:hypothetical protein